MPAVTGGPKAPPGVLAGDRPVPGSRSAGVPVPAPPGTRTLDERGAGRPGVLAGDAAAPVLLGLAVLAGAAGAVQGAVNGALAQRLGSAFDAAVVNNASGLLVLLLATTVTPALRRGVGALRRARLPWWTYLGGVIGAALVSITAYAVPVLGVSMFAIAQICGLTIGALLVDRTALGPAGRLPLSRSRLVGASLGLAAVAVSQIGRPVGVLAAGLIAAVVLVAAATAVQVALNARVTAATGSAGAATVVNFAVGTPAVTLVALMIGVAPHGGLPGTWWLYLGGLCGVFIVLAGVLAVPRIGVLRMSLAMTAGQLGSALLIDELVPRRAGLTVWLAIGALLTIVAVRVAGSRSGRGGADRRGGSRSGPGGADRRGGSRSGRGGGSARDGRLGEREH